MGGEYFYIALPGSIFTLNKVNLYEYGFLRHPQLVDSTTENRFEAKLWIVVDNEKGTTTFLWHHSCGSDF